MENKSSLGVVKDINSPHQLQTLINTQEGRNPKSIFQVTEQVLVCLRGIPEVLNLNLLSRSIHLLFFLFSIWKTYLPVSDLMADGFLSFCSRFMRADHLPSWWKLLLFLLVLREFKALCSLTKKRRMVWVFFNMLFPSIICYNWKILFLSFQVQPLWMLVSLALSPVIMVSISMLLATLPMAACPLVYWFLNEKDIDIIDCLIINFIFCRATFQSSWKGTWFPPWWNSPCWWSGKCYSQRGWYCQFHYYWHPGFVYIKFLVSFFLIRFVIRIYLISILTCLFACII